MANGAALINEAMWRTDREFRALPRTAQCMFLQLLSQKDLDCAGVLTLHVDLLAKGCDELTPDAIWHDLKTLEAARFVFVDADTDELLVRSYARRVSVKNRNAFSSALRSAGMVGSPKLRYELAAELRRLNRADAEKVADEIAPSNDDYRPDETPSEPRPDAVDTPSRPHTPSGPRPNAPVLVPVPVLNSPPIDGLEGEEPPPPRCLRHANTDDPPSCHGCRQARERRELWEVHRVAAAAARRSTFKAEVEDCPDCDENGWLDGGDELIRCPAHDWNSHA